MTLAVILVVLIAFAGAISVTAPSHFEVRREITIHAPASMLFDFSNSIRQWEQWSPFSQEAGMQATYSGPECGAGARCGWSSKRMGSGVSTITYSRPSEIVVVELEMTRPTHALNRVEFLWWQQGESTRMAWVMSGRNGFLARLVGRFVDVDRMVGGQFERGLAALKTLAEREAASARRN